MTTQQITFHFKLKDSEGNLLDTSYTSAQPIHFAVGQNQLTPKALENALTDRRIGEKITLSLSPEDAFGKRHEERLVVIPISEIKLAYEGQTIEQGQKVLLNLPESLAENTKEQYFTITGVLNGMVALDGNHPLAGETLTYEIEIIDIK